MRQNIKLQYLDNRKYNALIKKYELTKKNGIKGDDAAYEKMFKILFKYNNIKEEEYLIIKDVLNKYIDISEKIIYKMDFHTNKNINEIYNYINWYTTENLNFKILMIKTFQDIGIIEETRKEDIFYNPFKKLVQVLSIKYRTTCTKNSKDLYESSKSSEIQQKGRKIIQQIIKLNNESYLVNQKHLIKPTNSTMEITCYLPDIVVDNENDFKRIIDYLYKLFWENSGIKNYAKNNELDIINSLRRYFFHDLQHGDNSSIKKKFKIVKDFYKESCFKVLPSTPKDWQKVQEHIYDKLLLFLENVTIIENLP